MTLDEMLIETTTYIDENINKTSGEYVGDDLKLANKLKSALNYAYKKICREKYLLECFETLSNNSPLSKKFYKLISLFKAGTNEKILYSIKSDNIYYDYEGQVDILYNYIPDELSSLSDVPLLPESSVDHRILCFFAAFQYFNIEDDDRSSKWLNLFNDGFESIKKPKSMIQTTDIYNIGGNNYD